MRKLYELKNQRAEFLTAAKNALEKKDMETYNAKMAEVKALNADIEAQEALDAEDNRFTGSKQPIPQQSAKQPTTSRSGEDYSNAFCDAMRMGISVKNAASNENFRPLINALKETGGDPAGSDGGFLVPVDFDNKIKEERRQLVSLADLFYVENVTTLTGWRVIDAAPTKGFTKVSEMGDIPKDDQPKFKKIPYSIEEYALILGVSNDLLNDNNAGLMAYLARWFARKSVITENSVLKAMLDTLTAKVLTAKKELAGLKSAINKDLDPAIAANASIITNQSGFDFLDQMNDSNGRPLLQPDPTTGTPMLFKNKRVAMLSDAELPNRVEEGKGEYYPIYVGDFKSFGTLFRRQPLEVATTSIGGSAWGTNSTEARGIIRLDSKQMDEKAAIKREIFVPAI